MQTSEITGHLVFEPNFSYITGEKQLFICRSVIVDLENHTEGGTGIPNLHMIVCFGTKAKYVAEHCKKGQLVTVKGRFLNHNYKDYNGTKHYTDFFLVTEINTLQEDMENNAKERELSKEHALDYMGLNYMREHGYSMIDERVYLNYEDLFEEVAKCYPSISIKM